jgi:hypothetical protein
MTRFPDGRIGEIFLANHKPGSQSDSNAHDHQHGIAVMAPIARIVPDRDGGWLVVTHHGHGWLHGNRQSALKERRWLDEQWWGQR